jgi:hypothetical protein
MTGAVATRIVLIEDDAELLQTLAHVLERACQNQPRNLNQSSGATALTAISARAYG